MAENHGGNLNEREEIVYQTVPCSIKCALKKWLKSNENRDRIVAAIRENSVKCTRIARLASLLIHFVFNSIMDQNDDVINQFFNVTDNCGKNSDSEKIINGYFYSVLGNRNYSPEYPMQQYGRAFLEMMNRFGIEPPDNDYMDNTFKHQYQQFHTNFKNNICMHARKRIADLFKRIKYQQSPVPQNISVMKKKEHRKANNTAVYHTIRFLFDGTTTEIDWALINEFERILRPGCSMQNLCGLFDDLQHDWFKMLPLFFRLQRYIFAQQEAGQIERDFVVVPQTSFQRRHILIDTTSLFGIHASLGIVPMRTKKKKAVVKDFTKTPGKYWSEVLNYEALKTLDTNSNGEKKFDYTIFSDGLAMSLCCQKTIAVQDDEYNLRKCQRKYKEGTFTQLSGLDPGKRLVLGGIVRNISTKAERNVRVWNKKFYRYTRYNRRNKAKKRLDNELQTQMLSDRATYEFTPSNKR